MQPTVHTALHTTRQPARRPDPAFGFHRLARAAAVALGCAGFALPALAAQALPADGARDVSRLLQPGLHFASPELADAAARAGIELLTPVGSRVAGVLRLRGADVVFEPAAALAACSTYTLVARATGLRRRFTTACSRWSEPEQIDDRLTAHRPGLGADDVQLASVGMAGALAAWSQSNGRRGAVEASVLHADTASWGAPHSIDLRGAGGAALPSLATLADGQVLAAWIQDVQGHAGVYARIVGQAGPPLRLDDPARPVGPAEVRVAADADGHAVAVWQQPGARHSAVWAAHWDSGTARWTPPRQLDPAGPPGYAPVVAGAGDDRFAVAWERGPAGRESVAGSLWQRGHWTAPRRLSVAGARAQRPLLALSGDGRLLGMAWIQGRGPRRRVALARWHLGDPGMPPARVLRVPGLHGAAASAALAFDPAGNLALAWEQQAQASSPDVIEAVRWARDAAAPGSATRLDPPGQRSAGNPVLVSDPAGNLVCAWYQDSRQGLQVLAARYDASSARWQGALLLSDTRRTVQASFPDLTVDAAGSVTAAWQQFNGWRDIVVASRLP